LNTAGVLAEILAGRRMNNAEFCSLYEQGDFLAIARAANQIRERRHPGGRATFIVDRNINYTNICSCRCKFCAFYRGSSDADAYVLDQEEILARVEEAVHLGATQVMIQGGLNDDLPLEYFEEMFRSIKERYQVTIHSLTAPEISFIAKRTNLSVRDTLLRLREAGLDSLPGGGAEVLHDEVRQAISPNKIKSAEWLQVMAEAHRIGMKTTATMMMGSLDRIEHRVHHLDQVRSLQDQTGGFRSFIAWTYQPGNNELPTDKISSMLYLKFLALARLYLDNFEHIQGSWVTQGKRVGQLSLFFGADDLGSIMLEENVVRAAGLEQHMEAHEMVQLIRETGYIPALRDTEYRIIRCFDK
jgi:cyclic dehypoxanthinyl futalosine synthase